MPCSQVLRLEIARWARGRITWRSSVFAPALQAIGGGRSLSARGSRSRSSRRCGRSRPARRLARPTGRASACSRRVGRRARYRRRPEPVPRTSTATADEPSFRPVSRPPLRLGSPPPTKPSSTLDLAAELAPLGADHRPAQLLQDQPGGLVAGDARAGAAAAWPRSPGCGWRPGRRPRTRAAAGCGFRASPSPRSPRSGDGSERTPRGGGGPAPRPARPAAAGQR